ncbi:MAG: DUF3450 family protein [Verrucomicrobia bacterium]|nr:DUF3450 family protein [Verrucomicrobiota bacterium]
MAASLVASSIVTTPAHGQTIRETQDALISWVDTRKAIAETEAEWLSEKEIVADLITLLESEKEKLEEGIEELEDSSDATDARRAELNETRETLLETTDALSKVVPQLEAEVRALIEKLPDPLVSEMSQLITRLPDPDAETRMPLSQRLLTVVGILNRIDKFNTAITVTTEIRSIGERNVEVKTLYFGLAGAYFASAGGDFAGYGSADETGWNWTEDASIAGNVVNLIKTYEGNREATFVELPVQTD